MFRPAILLLSLAAVKVFAGPVIEPGDLSLRHDIQQLADYGVIKSPVTTWPLAWAPILNDIREADASNLPPAIVDALARVRQRSDWETGVDRLQFETGLGVADNATRIRSFQDTPRGSAEVSAGAGWIGKWLSIDLNAQYVDSSRDSEEVRFDNSMVGVAAGNWSIAASTLERWWGPGWDGSLILSNNARPIPSLTIDRISTDPFRSRWLSWLGPWDLSVMFGQLEDDREVPNAQFFGMRFNFKPFPSLEVGLTRTAQWCGDDRPCDLSTFGNLLLGRDNRGDAGIGTANEPGNQLAGVDFRWSHRIFDKPVAFYGQFIGEDEAGGFPSRFLGLGGVEFVGFVGGKWSYRAYGEFAGTSCQFHESSELFNCAYNNSIYRTGYRYRGRAIGHGADNDARLLSAGLVLVDSEDQRWHALVRYGELNRGGPPDSRNTLTDTREDILSIDISHSRAFWFGVLDLGVGHERVEDPPTGNTDSEGRIYLQWRSAY